MPLYISSYIVLHCLQTFASRKTFLKKEGIVMMIMLCCYAARAEDDEIRENENGSEMKRLKVSLSAGKELKEKKETVHFLPELTSLQN